MTTKIQALDRALGVIREEFMEPNTGGIVHLGHCSADHEFRLETSANSFTYYPYAPPVEAPPAGSIVEVWDDDAWGTILAYSSGKLSDTGKLWTSMCKGAAVEGRPDTGWPNWRVIKEVGE